MWPFKKKPIIDHEYEDYIAKERKLREEGWRYWIHQPPIGIEAVYARRTEDDAVELIYPDKLYAAFNVANLWWLPHFGENRLN